MHFTNSSNKWMKWNQQQQQQQRKKNCRTFVCLVLFLLFRVCTDRLLLFVVCFTWIYHFNIFLAEPQISTKRSVCTVHFHCFLFFFFDSFAQFCFVYLIFFSAIFINVNRHFFVSFSFGSSTREYLAPNLFQFVTQKCTISMHVCFLPINNAPNVTARAK